MRVRFLVLIIMALVMSQIGASRAEAFVFIHEFLADPATNLAGDANGDGTRHSYDDEFVELFNLSSSAVDLTGWYITDSANSGTLRHTFGISSLIDPYSTYVVFGGGQESLFPGNWVAASEGSLALNNGGDTITLYDASDQVIDFVTYGSAAGNDQSIVRSPEGSKSEWIKHAELSNADGKLFSPGYLVNEIDPVGQSTVPEPATVLSLAFGLGSFVLLRKKR